MSNFAIEFTTKQVLGNDILQEQRIAVQNVTGTIKQENERFILELVGEKEEVLCILRSIWELASLYDGYFYRPVNYVIDGEEQTVKDLHFLSYYNTGGIWMSSAVALAGSNKDFSNERISKYNSFRNQSRPDGKLIKSMINSYYYLRSDRYEGINVNHRLCLFLNLCDGLASALYGTDSINASVSRIINSAKLTKKVKYGASLLGIPKGKVFKALAAERNEIDHYIIKNGSISEYEMNAIRPMRNYINFYFTYVVELAIRITILKIIGFECEEKHIDNVIDNINDWVIIGCDMNEECSNEINRFRQELKQLGIEFC